MPNEENKKYGYVKKYRSVLQSEFWKETSPEQYKIAEFILYSVRFKSEEIELRNGEKITIEPGQLLTTISFIQNGVDPKGKWATEKTIKYALDKLQKLGFLSKRNIKSVPKIWVENDKKGALLIKKRGRTKKEKGLYLNKNRVVQCTLVTIENWAFYQCEIEKGALLNQNKGFTSDEKGLCFDEKGAITKECIYKNDIYNMSDSKESDHSLGAFKDELETKAKSKGKKFDDTSIEYKLSKTLLESIREINPKFKEPNLQNWSKDFDKIIRLDKREIKDITDLIDWIYQNNFWKSNILSPGKLRKQFDNLYTKMINDKDYKKTTAAYLEKPSETDLKTAADFWGEGEC